MKIASRLVDIKPSITLAVTARAARLRASGVDVIGFGAGEPDMDTPDHIKDAAKRALDAGMTKYTEVAGTIALRKAVAKEMERAHGLDFTAEQVLVSCGAKHSLYNLFQAILDEGDEVIIPAPYWVSYPDMVKLAGGKPVIIEGRAENNFCVGADDVRRALGPRTRAFVLNSPSNPTGGAYDFERLHALREVLEEHDDLIVVSDDIYRKLTYGGFQFHQIATLSRAMAERTVIVDGWSKTYSMTGWRMGFACGPRPIIAAMTTLQGQSTSNPTSIAQAAAIAALEGPQDCVEQMRQEFDRRRQKIVGLLRAIPGVRCFDPQGAFYAFPDLSAYLGKRPKGGTPLEDDVALCDYLLDIGKVAVVPGSGFGAPGFVRLSYATSMDNIVRGLERMSEALAALSIRLLAVCLGGAAGSGARYLVGLATTGTWFPYGTLLINAVGSFLLAALMFAGMEKGVLPPAVRLALTTGVMGGFTTYSTFSFETLALLQTGHGRLAAAYIAATVLGCLAATWLGWALARAILA